ncbi:MAG: hypothetical protein H8E32_15865 [Nitrospinae bacterium]|nr:hypothetical protein [Nitrospinota bacterium]
MNKATLKDWMIFPLKNERGVAALMGVIMGILIVGTIAFNFLAESRQKQSGAILTYTSTNAFMIAEAGLRHAQKCLLETEATCSTDFPDSQTSTTWSTDITTADNYSNDFGGGSFTVSFPTHASNGDDVLLVVSTGTYKGAQRSIQRFILNECVLSTEAATSCLGTTTNNNASIDPEPDEESLVCPSGGIVDDLDPAPADCTGCPNAACPDFNAGTHLSSEFLIPRANNYFCDMDISGTTVLRTTETDGTNTDDNILVAGDFTVQDTATVRLSSDAADPDNTDETIITVYGNSEIRELGEIRVNGAFSHLVGGTFTMRNSSKVNSIQGDTGDATMAVEGNITIRNSSLYKGALLSDATITVQNNGEVEGALQGNSVVLPNNATLIFSEDSGEDTTAIEQCASNDVPPGWSE